MTILEGDLEWPLADGVCEYPTGLSPALKTLAEQAAAEWLWSLTARVFGTFAALYRPQTRVLSCWGADYPSWLQPISGPLYGSGWPYSGDPLNDGLGVKQVVELVAPVAPPTVSQPLVVSIYDPITGVGTVLSTADTTPLIRVEGNYLVRQDGGIFPDTQNMIAELGTKNTWAVDYRRGTPVPVGGQIAAAYLACEFAKRFNGDTKCRLPSNTTTVSRAGVTINRDALKAMRTTGVAEADQWVTSVNPAGLAQAPAVWSPDTSRNARPFAGSYAPTT